MNKILAMLTGLMLFSTVACAHEGHDHEKSPVIEGKHYTKIVQQIPTDDDSKIEVRELFWYGCPHCYKLEPHIEHYKKNLAEDVAFVPQPAIFSPRWEVDAKVHYAFKFMGILDEAHTHYFNAIHRDKKRFKDAAAVGEWLESVGLGKSDEFVATYESFAVDGSVRRAKQLTTKYGIDGVPAIVVNGKYLTSVSKAGSEAKLIEVINHLVDMERSK